MNRPVRFVGMLRSPASWAKVARELCLALIGEGAHVCVDEQLDDRFEADFPLGPELSAVLARSCARPEEEHGTFTFAAPDQYADLALGRVSVGLLAWEATRWPVSWVEAARSHVGRVVLPSRFAAETLVASGLPASRVGVVPHGVDRRTYHPGDRPPAGGESDLRLLFVGTPARRKGLDALVDVVRHAFPDGRGVRLTVKMVPYEDAATRPYLDHEWRGRLAMLDRDGYDVEIVERVVREAEMADLYRAADLLCHPFRGECFPLPFLEAMACGTPVVCTGWSGPLDLIDDRIGRLVPPASLVPAAGFLPQPEMVGDEALMAEPDVVATARAVVELDRDRGELGRLGVRAGEAMLRWTWAEAARALLEELDRTGR